MDLAPQIGAVIDTLASKMAGLQAPAAHVWSVMVRQQVISGVVSIVPFAVTVVLCAPLFTWARKKRAAWAEDGQRYQREEDLVMIMGALITGAIILCISFGFALNGAQHILNPEYYAIMSLKP